MGRGSGHDACPAALMFLGRRLGPRRRNNGAQCRAHRGTRSAQGSLPRPLPLTATVATQAPSRVWAEGLLSSPQPLQAGMRRGGLKWTAGGQRSAAPTPCWLPAHCLTPPPGTRARLFVFIHWKEGDWALRKGFWSPSILIFIMFSSLKTAWVVKVKWGVMLPNPSGTCVIPETVKDTRVPRVLGTDTWRSWPPAVGDGGPRGGNHGCNRALRVGRSQPGLIWLKSDWVSCPGPSVDSGRHVNSFFLFLRGRQPEWGGGKGQRENPSSSERSARA